MSQLPLLSKLTECALQVQLLSFLENTKQLSVNSHAYRKNLSTTTAVLQIMDLIQQGTDENLFTATLGMDQSAAFDCVNHSILVNKLKYYNIDNNCIKWIESYLSNRSSYVVVGSANSKIFSQEYGVPQGSVLGPLLYLVYLNEIGETVKDDICPNQAHQDNSRLFGQECSDCGQLPVYADDSLYVVSSKSRFRNQLMLEDKFVCIKKFLNANGLQINDGKTTVSEFMSCQKRAKSRGIPPELTVQVLETNILSDRLIIDSPVCRTLGINLQNNLGWTAHLQTGKKSILPVIR